MKNVLALLNVNIGMRKVATLATSMVIFEYFSIHGKSVNRHLAASLRL